MLKFTVASKTNGTLRKIPWSNRWVVQDPFVWYVDYENKVWEVVVPAGFWTDFWTIPILFRPLFNPTQYLSYVLHDYLYTFHEFDRRKCDKILYEALITEWMNKLWSLIIYIAVRSFGWVYY